MKEKALWSFFEIDHFNSFNFSEILFLEGHT